MNERDNQPRPVPTDIAQRIARFDRRLRRRSLLGGAVGFSAIMALGGRDLRSGPAASASVRAQDVALPDDAAPPEQQVFVMPNRLELDKTPDFYE